MLRKTPALLGLLTALATVTAFAADTNSDKQNTVDPEVELALTIVNDYRTLRNSCSDLDGQARMDCFYRLRIGLWDYKAAREILTAHGIRVESGEMVAQSN
ncbi:hypothetical protein [Pseudomaricurvus sp. HS19]|uniref:hypothetical protein n=1 Tax=Pseudomaricurvus sp. HS19 TaxID=2692626 RepID=UPI00136AE0BF|nr:hypothetical protein [Pseudomaricurvus sp. HS19]MYM62238.1 hypothetical protein [Pseudomaricurvus sp. HS19]